MADIAVKPARKGMGLSHPTAGLLPDEPNEEGKWPQWPADQFTFRRLRDGDILRVEEEAEGEEPQAPADAPSKKRS